MTAIALLLCANLSGNVSKGFTATLDGGPLSKVFSPMFSPEESINSRKLRANGVATGIVFPEILNVYTVGFDAKGRPIGGLTGSVSGARIVVLDYGVMAVGDKYEVVCPLPKYPSTKFLSVSKSGQILGIAYEDTTPNLDGPSDTSHGFLIDKGKVIDLGPAAEVSFRKDGSVEGYYIGDKEGRPHNVIMHGYTMNHYFHWQDGKRKPLVKSGAN